MSPPDFSMLVIAALASVAAGLAYAMLTREKPGIVAAKVLSSLSAIGFGSLGVIWGVTSSAYPLGLRVVAASVLGAIVAGALTWIFADINGQSKALSPTPPGPPKQAAEPSQPIAVPVPTAKPRVASAFPRLYKHWKERAKEAPPMSRMGNDNTIVGNVLIPENMGDGNTIVGATDANGNTILNRGGTAIGRNAQADQTTVAIGANAGAGVRPKPKP